MTATILAFFTNLSWTSIAGAVLGIGGLIFGWARHKSAQTTEAKADQKVSAMEGQVAAANAQVAQASAQSAATAVQAQQQAKATPDADLDAALAAQGALRK